MLLTSPLQFGEGIALSPAPDVSIVVPTFNERENVAELLAKVAAAVAGMRWEIIVVDDDSPDGTCAIVREIARAEPRIRCIRRIGRRGLASAVVEGALAANGEAVLVMDADFQHDESQIPAIHRRLIAEGADVVVATRYSGGGSVGDWSGTRHGMSRFAGACARLATGAEVSDPMSGFFMARTEVIHRLAGRMAPSGYKILFDLLCSAPSPLRVAEHPYHFRGRRAGESKLSASILTDFGFLLVEKLTGGIVPSRFARFATVGGLGLVYHLGILNLLSLAGVRFLTAQLVATGSAIVLNYTINNRFTFPDARRRGARAWLAGLAMFGVACGFGTLANIGVAEFMIGETDSWTLAGLAGAAMSAVFNFAMASRLVWANRRRPNG